MKTLLTFTVCLNLVLGSLLLVSCNSPKKDPWDIEVKKVRTAKYEIPVTHGIIWASDLNRTVIDSFEVSVIESDLHMYYDTSLLSYTVYGHVVTKNNSTSLLKQIHIAERINTDTALKCDGIIEITPIVTLEFVENKKKGIDHFHFTNEIALSSLHYGDNIFHFKCFDKTQTISIFQSK